MADELVTDEMLDLARKATRDELSDTWPNHVMRCIIAAVAPSLFLSGQIAGLREAAAIVLDEGPYSDMHGSIIHTAILARAAALSSPASEAQEK